MKIYAMSDIHGSPIEFEAALELVDLSGDNKLILCGDYVHGYDSYSVLDRIIELQEKYGSDKVIALMGNHEEMVMDGRWPITMQDDIISSKVFLLITSERDEDNFRILMQPNKCFG